MGSTTVPETQQPERTESHVPVTGHTYVCNILAFTRVVVHSTEASLLMKIAKEEPFIYCRAHLGWRNMGLIKKIFHYCFTL